jgi:8-oxo-dGTP diphosphatase
MKRATLVFIIKTDDKERRYVLLGEKKTAEIGTGTLNGPGGKIEENEGEVECLLRETREEFEIDLDSSSLYHVANTLFLAGGMASFFVTVYLCTRYSGELVETDSMYKPEWYPIDTLPFERMLEADRHWVPRVLSGEKFSAQIYYREKAKGFERIEFFPFGG